MSFIESSARDRDGFENYFKTHKKGDALQTHSIGKYIFPLLRRSAHGKGAIVRKKGPKSGMESPAVKMSARLSFILTLLKNFSFSCVLEGLTMYSFKECTLLRLFSHPEGLLSDAFIWIRKRTRGADVVVQTRVWHRKTFSFFFVYEKDFSESTVHAWNRIFEEAARERGKKCRHFTSLDTLWMDPKMENVFRWPLLWLYA